MPQPTPLRVDYYKVLGIPPRARDQEVRQAYRRLCRVYHPDTTELAPAEALEKFLILKEAYATLSDPIKRVRYDQSRVSARPSPPPQRHNVPTPDTLEIRERALSNTELFALSILGLAFAASLLLVGFVSVLRG